MLRTRILSLLALSALNVAAARGDIRCPADAINVGPTDSIQAAVDKAGEKASICLRSGTFRSQAIRPLYGQKFFGQTGAVLNGSVLQSGFTQRGRIWAAPARMARTFQSGICAANAPLCDLPGAVFFDDMPLTRVGSLVNLASGQYAYDAAASELYIADDPSGHTVEVATAIFAFGDTADDVSIDGLVIEKYASPAQRGAINALGRSGWSITNCEVRLNRGAGIILGSDGRVTSCNIHHNGQLGIGGEGSGITIEGSEIHSNNTGGFDFGWEAGGVKIGSGESVVLRNNRVHDNVGAGLWCDIDCREVLYEGNEVTKNHGAGIFFEISSGAVIRNNRLAGNGIADRKWFWGADIQIAAAENVEVYNNTIAVSPGGCGVVLIDQGRKSDSGRVYKTRNNYVHDNNVTFAEEPCAGGASDVSILNENFRVITEGNNRFDSNVFVAPKQYSGGSRFVWGHDTMDWHGFRALGQERNGRLVEQ